MSNPRSVFLYLFLYTFVHIHGSVYRTLVAASTTGNDVTDLLKNGERVGHNKVSSQRYVMSGQAKRNVNSLEDIRDALATGKEARQTIVVVLVLFVFEEFYFLVMVCTIVAC